jgi:hypothetical protein
VREDFMVERITDILAVRFFFFFFFSDVYFTNISFEIFILFCNKPVDVRNYQFCNVLSLSLLIKMYRN